jgi:YidC/Oxa1 family membrane protein insertase
MFLADLFVQFIYQPFFNILIFFYWMLDQLPNGAADMGVAVILLTILIRILLLPLSLAGDRSAKERREIAEQIKRIDNEHSAEPIVQREQRKRRLMQSRGVLIAEIFNLCIQVAIALMLWRIFAKGLEGEDFHLIYSFMPQVDTPFNLMFMDTYDLSHSHFVLNLVQSVSIFVLETVSIITSPYPHTRGEVVRLQLVLPVMSFVIFMFLPAGKKLFVITALWFSILVTIYKFIRRKMQDYQDKLDREREAAEAAAAAHEPILAKTV